MSPTGGALGMSMNREFVKKARRLRASTECGSASLRLMPSSPCSFSRIERVVLFWESVVVMQIGVGGEVGGGG